MTSLRSDGSVEFRFYRPQAGEVKISGDFNGWSHHDGAVSMRKLDGGWWAAEAKLDAGEYRFRYLADGHTWFTDFASHGIEVSKFGGWNSVLVVPTKGAKET